MKNTLNMTEGKPLRQLALFSVPLMLGNIFQLLYTLVDSAVVGRLIGVGAFAAVGAAGFLSWMVLNIIFGFTQGFGILFAQCFGAADMPGLRRAVAMSVYLSALATLLLTALGTVFARAILVAIDTPADILPDALTFLYWIIGGTAITFLYNLLASLLRALGNSKTPLYAAIAANVLNAALAVAVVLWLGMGVAGVAIATLLSHLLACVICAHKLRAIPGAVPTKADFAPDRQTVRKLLRLSMPLVLRDAVISVGSIVVQYVTNGFGTMFIAGTTAAKRYYGLIEIFGGALDGGVGMFVAQNYGAGRYGRIRSCVRISRRFALISALALVALIIPLRGPLIALLVSGEAAQVETIVGIGAHNLLAMAGCLPFLYFLYLYRSGLQGLGNTTIPMLSGFVELALRIASVLLLPRFFGEWGVYLADGIGWIGAAALLFFSYRAVFKRRMDAAGLDSSEAAS